MIAVFSVLLVVTLSMLVTRVASVALVHTGMGREAARFQARSAFTGAGFTTTESEDVVSHPVRRRIVAWLMLAGNVGIVTAMSSLLLSFVDMRGTPGPWLALGVLAGGIALLLFVSSSAWVDRHLCRAISWALGRFTDIDARDYARLLHLRDDYGVSDLWVRPGDWLSGRTLADAGLAREGILVLGIECPGGSFIGAPAEDTEIRDRDRLLLYGRTSRIAEIDRRIPDAGGEEAHHAAVAEHRRIAGDERSAAGR
ncbi:MAG: TrkA C-terminal domain-containing protein [Myxococcota bacterium]|nr:TrkA C-terminal domain-containing protein [Myxococcota bacterium]